MWGFVLVDGRGALGGGMASSDSWLKISSGDFVLGDGGTISIMIRQTKRQIVRQTHELNKQSTNS